MPKTLLAFLLLFASTPAVAAVHIWTGASSNLFSDASNWRGGSPAGDSAADLVFPSGVSRLGVTNDLPGLTVRSISISGAGYTIGGQAMTLASDAEVTDSTTGPNAIECNLHLTGGAVLRTETIDLGAGLTLSGAISGTGPLTTLGPGRMIFAGPQANTYSGETVVLNGELRLTKNDGVEAIPGDLRIGDRELSRDPVRLITLRNEQIRDTATIYVAETATFGAGGIETVGPLEVVGGASIHTAIASFGTTPSIGTMILSGDVNITFAVNPATFNGDFALAGMRTVTACENYCFPTLRGFRDHTPASGLILRGGSINVFESSYHGPTVVESGFVRIDNPQTSVKLLGGFFSGEVGSLVAEGGTIDARDGRIGVWTVGDLRLNRDTTVLLSFEGPGYRLRAGGTLDLGRASLVLEYGPQPAPIGTTYPIGLNDGSQPIRAPFDDLPEGAILQGFRVSYVGGNGNDLTLTQVARYPTFVSLDAMPGFGVAGAPITLDAEVRAFRPDNTPVTSGQVTFREGNNVVGVAALDASGHAVVTIHPGPGQYRYTASFAGDAVLAPSISPAESVSVSAPVPTITSLDPSTVQGGTTATFTIRGTNFLPNGSVVIDFLGVPWTWISSTEARVTWDVPLQENDRTVEVRYQQNPGPQSNTLPLLVKGGPVPRSPLTFEQTAVSGPVVPGGSAAWMSISLRRVNFTTVREHLSAITTDTDRDGITRWEQTAAPPELGIWLMADMTDGRLVAGKSDDSIPPAEPFPHAMFLRDEQGRYAHIVLELEEMWELLWVRPGVGAWKMTFIDGNVADLDKAFNGYGVFHVSQAQPIAGSPAVPAGFEPGDVVAGIDWSLGAWFGDKVDAHLGESNGPGTLMLVYPSGFSRNEEAGATVPVGVMRVGGTDGTLSANYNTVDHTAMAGVHYERRSGTLTFGPGEILKTFEIPIIDDGVYGGLTQFKVFAGAESFNVFLFDDDPRPQLSAESMTVIEGDRGMRDVQFVVTLNGTTRAPVTATWAASTFSGNGVGGKLVFTPGGPTSQTLTVPYLANETPEGDRIYNVLVYQVENATPQSLERTITIKDDDVAELTILDTTVSESRSEVRVLIRMMPPTNRDVTVKYTTENGSATAGADFTSTSGTAVLHFSSTVLVTIPLLADGTAEGDEWFTVTLSDPTNGRIRRATATVLIRDDEAPMVPSITIGAPVVTEGQQVVFRFYLSHEAQQEVSFRARTVDGSATAGADFGARDHVVVIPPGFTELGILTQTVNDSQSEETETFTLVLSDPVGATIATPSAVGTILDEDTAIPNVVRIFMTGANVVEGNPARFEVKLESAQSSAVTVAYTTTDGTAIAPGDYAAASGTLTFAPGETVKVVEVAVVNDTQYESDESFTLVLGNAVNGWVAVEAATARVINDDPVPPPKGRAVRH